MYIYVYIYYVDIVYDIAHISQFVIVYYHFPKFYIFIRMSKLNGSSALKYFELHFNLSLTCLRFIKLEPKQIQAEQNKLDTDFLCKMLRQQYSHSMPQTAQSVP